MSICITRNELETGEVLTLSPEAKKNLWDVITGLEEPTFRFMTGPVLCFTKEDYERFLGREVTSFIPFMITQNGRGAELTLISASRLGVGTYKEVYLGFHRTLYDAEKWKGVAVKICDLVDVRNGRSVLRGYATQKAMYEIMPTGVPYIFTPVVTSEKPFLKFTEGIGVYVESYGGECVGGGFQRSDTPLVDKLSILCFLLGILRAAHEKLGRIHGDVKVSNVVILRNPITKRAKYYFIDWDLSKKIHCPSYPSRRVATRKYEYPFFSPARSHVLVEQNRQRCTILPECDIWGLLSFFGYDQEKQVFNAGIVREVFQQFSRNAREKKEKIVFDRLGKFFDQVIRNSEKTWRLQHFAYFSAGHIETVIRQCLDFLQDDHRECLPEFDMRPDVSAEKRMSGVKLPEVIPQENVFDRYRPVQNSPLVVFPINSLHWDRRQSSRDRAILNGAKLNQYGPVQKRTSPGLSRSPRGRNLRERPLGSAPSVRGDERRLRKRGADDLFCDETLS